MNGISRRSFLSNACLVTGGIVFRNKRLFALDTASPSVVKTPSGTLRGESAGGVRRFRGVPFAEPPVGPLRFRAAVEAKPWKGEREATQFSKAPMQAVHPPGSPAVPLEMQSEDCLYLNIWAPEGAGPFPVFVWIHGGGFIAGHAFEAIYDGSEFARQGIVCITVAYRLGVFGFLDFAPLLGREYEGTANNGLSDLVMALAWIQDNIAAFGGDPGKVTIGGESAGAKLTDILMGVPAARPLFQQMISESGGAERIWQHGGAVGIAKGFEQAWKEDSGATTDDALKTADGAALIKTQEKLLSTWPLHYPLRAEVDGRLVPQLPIQRIAGGSTRGKRLLIGTNREESALFIGAHPSEVAAINLGNIDLAKFNEVFARYKELYPKLTREQLRIRAVTAEEYWVPSMRVAEAHVHGGGTAYVYELEFVETSGRLADNAYHSLDVGMVWGHPHMQVADAEAEAALGKQMHAAWVAFIRGDAPGAPGLPAWPDYTAETHATMILGADGGATSRVEQGPQAAELALWGGVL